MIDNDGCCTVQCSPAQKLLSKNNFGNYILNIVLAFCLAKIDVYYFHSARMIIRRFFSEKTRLIFKFVYLKFLTGLSDYAYNGSLI